MKIKFIHGILQQQQPREQLKLFWKELMRAQRRRR